MRILIIFNSNIQKMSFYDILSVLLTVLGNIVLIYRIVFQLSSGKVRRKTEQKLCTKYVIFAIFLKLEYWFLAVLEIIPLGSLSLLVIKLLLFLPENKISTMIYQKIQKKLEKISLDQYNSQFGQYLSFLSKHLVIVLMKGIKKIAPYVNSKDIQETETHVLEIIKILEYKKAAIMIRGQAHASKINTDLNMTEFNTSMNEEESIERQQLEEKQQPKKRLLKKSTIGSQMSKILADIDDDQEVLRVKADLMIIRPNKQKGQKAKFEQVTIQYYIATSKISVINKNKAVQSGNLKEVRWVTKNMINLELVFDEGRSKIVKLRDKADVAKWVEPVCLELSKKK